MQDFELPNSNPSSANNTVSHDNVQGSVNALVFQTITMKMEKASILQKKKKFKKHISVETVGFSFCFLTRETGFLKDIRMFSFIMRAKNPLCFDY